ncbi:transposase [Ralstonia solanacearum]|nr:transposase [Ralstonia solanacearum]
MLASHLTYLLEAQQPADLSRLAEHLPYEWIERAVTATGTASIRRRRLPAEQVVWLVIALAMYRHWSISEVVDSLDLALPNESAAFVSKSAITQARERIGRAPLAWLFKRTAQAWTLQDGARHAIKGLSLWAIDGTTLRTPPTAPPTASTSARKAMPAARWPAIRRYGRSRSPPSRRIWWPTSASAAMTPTRWCMPRTCCPRFRTIP